LDTFLAVLRKMKTRDAKADRKKRQLLDRMQVGTASIAYAGSSS
jgi:hypothetical protein